MKRVVTAAGRRLRLREERGQGLVEYALIVSVVALGSIAALVFLRDEIKGVFSKAGSSITAGATGTTGGPGTQPVPGTLTITCLPGTSCDDDETATANVGTWGGSPAPALTYQWSWHTNSGAPCDSSSSGWTPLSPGTGNTQPLPNISGSDLVRVIVTGTNTAGSASAVACRIFDNAT